MCAASNFNEIYKTYHKQIHNYVSKVVGQTNAEDVTQEVFEKANRSLGKFKGRSSISTWLYRIATNTAIDKIRSADVRCASNAVGIDEIDAVDRLGSTTDSRPESIDQKIIQKEMQACIQEFVEQLPCDYKVVLILKEFEGLSNKEIADILQISLDNAKIRIHRARSKLKESLNAGCDFYQNDKGVLACDRKPVSILPEVPE